MLVWRSRDFRVEERNLERVVGHHRTRYDRAIDPYLVDFIVLYRSGPEVGELADALVKELSILRPEIACNIRDCMT